MGSMANDLALWAGKKSGGKFHLPKAHSPFMKIPDGSFSCANCRYLKDAKAKTCGEPNFVAWNGGPVIPADDLRKACSDWFEPR